MADDVVGGDRPLHMPVGAFEECLDWIASTYTVIPFLEVVSRVKAGRSLQGTAALTFDDAYAGVFRRAVPLLSERRVPATVFVVTGAASAPAFFWWDVLAASGALSDFDRRRCIETLRGDRDECLAISPDVAGRSLDSEMLPATWEEMELALASVTFGSHSVTHRTLSELSASELKQEMQRSRAEIAERFPGHGDFVSYPYGRYDATVVRAAKDAGYIGGAVLDARTTALSDDANMIPRINVPAGISRISLECRAADFRRPGR